MGGKRKRKLVAPGSSINKTPRPLPTRYDFVSKATTSNLPPVVLPNNNPAPSVRDYPPPRQLFPSSTFPPSGSAPLPQTQPPTRYMRLTDQKYLDFIASEASSPAPPDQ
ncbi:hypothetical protein HID58_028404 [Brassica napus]|uniref:Uncharacterized protein n=1 Tax=Brassica napus TaxID=3708 RepID=A0ABQ8CBN5_BRANA|nr:hypothetical protein HID58_028404 [Brassica napus]